MTVIHNCDNIVNFLVNAGVMALDNVRFVEGTGSVRFTNNLGQNYSALILWNGGAVVADFSLESVLRFKLRHETITNPLLVTIWVGADHWNYPVLANLSAGVFVESRVDLAVGHIPATPAPDLSQVTQVQWWLSSPGAEVNSFNLDWVEKILPTHIPDFLRQLPWWQ